MQEEYSSDDENKKDKEPTKVYEEFQILTKQIQHLTSTYPDNEKIKFLVEDLERIKTQLVSNIDSNTQTVNEIYKNRMYKSIQQNLIEISLISDKKDAEEKIDDFYKWYINNKSFFTELSQISYKNYIDDDQEMSECEEEEDVYTKKKREEQIKYHDVFIPHSKIKEFQSKRLMPEGILYRKIGNNIQQKRENKRFVLCKDNFNTKLKELIKFKAAKDENFTNSNQTQELSALKDKEAILDKIIERYINPNFKQLEKRMAKEKNKEIKLNRNKNEIGKALSDFGMLRSNYTGNLNKRNEITNLMEMYTEKLKKMKQLSENDESSTDRELYKPKKEILKSKNTFNSENGLEINKSYKKKKHFGSVEYVYNPIMDRVNRIDFKVSNDKDLQKFTFKMKIDKDKLVDENRTQCAIVSDTYKAPTNIFNHSIGIAAFRGTDMLSIRNLPRNKSDAELFDMRLGCGISIGYNLKINKEESTLEKYKKLPNHRFNKLNVESSKDYLTLRKNISAKNLREFDKIRRTSNLNSSHYKSLQNAYFMPSNTGSLPRIVLPTSQFSLLKKIS